MEELDLKELISIFMKRKVLIILVVIIFALTGAIYTTKFITPTYKSSTSLVLVQTGTEKNVDTNGSITTTDVTLNSKLVDNYKSIAVSKSVLTKVIQNLNISMTVGELQKILSVSTKADTEIIEISIEYTDPEMSCKIAREIANVLIEKTNEKYKLDNLSILDEPEVDYTPSNIHLTKNIVIFAFVGGILVSGYILLINMLDTTVKSDTDIERSLNIPVLASIVLTNDSAKKNVQAQAETTYKFSGFDSLEVLAENTKEDTSLFENYNNEEFEKKEDTNITENFQKPNNNYNKHNNYNNHKKHSYYNGRNKKQNKNGGNNR